MLLAVPALRALRAQRPGHPLVLAAQPRLGRLLTSLGEVDAAVDFEALGLGALFTAEPEGQIASALRHAGRVACWFGSRDPLFVANLRAIAPGALVAPPAAGDVPVWQHLRRTVGAALDGDTEPLRVSPALAEGGRRALRDAGWDGAAPVLLLHPGAGSAAKRWSTEGFAAVACAAGQPRPLALVVHEGPADAEAASALLAALGPGAIRLGEPSLHVLAGVLASAALYLGNDSGVSHLAAAVGAPSVVLFISDLLGWRPWSPATRLCVVSAGERTCVDREEVLAAARAALA